MKKKFNIPIVKALLKYGHSNFAFTIIEYLSEDNILKCETYWINILKPFYNVLMNYK